MSYLRDVAIVLRREPFREEDDRLTLYGRTHGKLECVARASRRLEAKALGHLDPLMEVEVMIAKGKAFDKLAVASVCKPRLALRRQLPLLTVCSSVARLLSDWTRPGSGESDLFDLLSELLNLAETHATAPSLERSRLLFSASALKMMDFLGYGPRLDGCVLCNASVGEGACLSFEKGGLLCSACARRAAVMEDALSDTAVRLLRFIRRESLTQLMQVTAPRGLFLQTANAVERFLERGALRHTASAPSAVLEALLV